MNKRNVQTAALEVMLFLITVVILFNMYADFAVKLGITAEPLPLWHVQIFGFAATFTAIINAFSDKLFGFTLVR